MTHRTITAVFDTQAEAQRAVEALVAQGIPRNDVNLHRDVAQSSDANTDKGFWASLSDLFVPTDDQHTYAEALRRGSVMVTVSVDEMHYDQAETLLETHGAVDMDERESGWRSEGWTGGNTTSDMGFAERGIAQDRTGGSYIENNPPGTMLSRGADEMAGTNVSGARPQNETGGARGSNPPGTMLSRGLDDVAGTNISGAHPENETGDMARDATYRGTADGMATDLSGTESIPVVQETLRVGKREVSGGRVRVRSYVVSTPVEEQVSLRSEHVDVQRRVVDRPVTDADRIFQDRTIEATESQEEAVISKDARVVEEVTIRKDMNERVETVSDTVRRTEVEVDRDGSLSGKPGTPRRDV